MECVEPLAPFDPSPHRGLPYHPAGCTLVRNRPGERAPSSGVRPVARGEFAAMNTYEETLRHRKAHFYTGLAVLTVLYTATVVALKHLFF